MLPDIAQYLAQDLLLYDLGVWWRRDSIRKKSPKVLQLVSLDDLQKEADRLGLHVVVKEVLARAQA